MKAPLDGSPLVLPQPGNRAIVLTVPAAPKGTQWLLAPVANGWQAVLMIPAGGSKAEIIVHTWAVPKDDAKLIRELK